ncbi:hypothetical protein R3P38DRAFT_3616733 [Favolaschia claudopus]|uniref:Uncharacterized protein n=1 Tax=Favolaschia claudopus TaxID=2862362 RepID=A0AAW0A393_9AGAR
MLSPRYQQSTASLLSYWSDNMSVGPNLPLHTLSKPTIRFLYQLQVKKFIKRNENYPLSEEMMEVFESYLAYVCVAAPANPALIWPFSRLKLLELEECFSTMEMMYRYSPSLMKALARPINNALLRSIFSFRDIAANKLHNWVMKNQTPDVLDALKYFSFAYQHCLPLSSRREAIMHELAERIRCLGARQRPSSMSSLRSLLVNIHGSSARIGIFVAIFELTSAENSPPDIQDLALHIFTSYPGGQEFCMELLSVLVIAQSSDRTRTSIMKSLAFEQNLVPNFLQDAACTGGICTALATLAQTEAALVIMLDLKLHVFLVQLLSDTTPADSQYAALFVLEHICAWCQGAQAVVFETDMLQAAKMLLRSESGENSDAVRDCLWTIAQHTSTFGSILFAGELSKPLVFNCEEIGTRRPPATDLSTRKGSTRGETDVNDRGDDYSLGEGECEGRWKRPRVCRDLTTMI